MKPFYTLLATTMLTGTLALQPALAADDKAAPPAKAEAPAKPDIEVEMSKEYLLALKPNGFVSPVKAY